MTAGARELQQDDALIYAVGDVHGMLGMLQALHAAIDAHSAERAAAGRARVIVHLGDYVDRGPDSAGVLAFLRKRKAELGGGLVLLRGNHEQMMLSACERGAGAFRGAGRESAREAGRLWRVNGGLDTERSYGRGRARLDADLRFLREETEDILILPERRLVFVHAGIEPDAPRWGGPRSYHWTRSTRFSDPSRWPSRLDGWTVVHGHTPNAALEPEHVRGPEGRTRINVDTGAVFGGPLTAAVLAPGEAPDFLQLPPSSAA